MATIVSVIFWLKIHSFGKKRHPVSPSSEASHADTSKIRHEVRTLLPLHPPYTGAGKTLTRPVRVVSLKRQEEDSAHAWSAQPCEHPPEENHSHSTELEVHTGVKEQAALSASADRGRCEAWPSFLGSVSIHPLMRRGELQGQLECLAAAKEYFIAKGWLPSKQFGYTHCLLQLDSNTWLNAHFPTQSVKVGWRAKNTERIHPYHRQIADPSCSRGQKASRTRGTTYTVPNSAATNWPGKKPFSSSFPSNFLYQCSFPAKPKGEWGMLAFSTSEHVQLCEENGKAYEEFRNQGKDFPLAFHLGHPQNSLGYGFNMLSLQHWVWASGTMNSHNCSERIKLNAQHQKWTLIQPFPAKLPASRCS